MAIDPNARPFTPLTPPTPSSSESPSSTSSSSTSPTSSPPSTPPIFKRTVTVLHAEEADAISPDTIKKGAADVEADAKAVRIAVEKLAIEAKEKADREGEIGGYDSAEEDEDFEQDEIDVYGGEIDVSEESEKTAKEATAKPKKALDKEVYFQLDTPEQLAIFKEWLSEQFKEDADEGDIKVLDAEAEAADANEPDIEILPDDVEPQEPSGEDLAPPSGSPPHLNIPPDEPPPSYKDKK